MQSEDLKQFVVSQFLTKCPLGEAWLAIANGIHLNRIIVPQSVQKLLDAAMEPITEIDAYKILESLQLPTSVFTILLTNSLLVPMDQDEEIELTDWFETSGLDIMGSTYIVEGRAFDIPTKTPIDLDLNNAKNIDVALLGGCSLQAQIPYLEEAGANNGLKIVANAGWPGDLHLIKHRHHDVVVLQPFSTWMLTDLIDSGVLLSDHDRRERLEIIKNQIDVFFFEVRSAVENVLMLVIGFCPPSFPSAGRMEHRSDINMRRIAFELNHHIEKLVKKNSNTMMIDEQQLFSRIGIEHVLDDSFATYGHRGAIDYSTEHSLERGERLNAFPNAYPHGAMKLVSQEIVDSYISWSNPNKIKCIITDLDGTLWPGTAGTPRFNLTGRQAYEGFRYGKFGGLHQALKILKSRGVLLATCSNNLLKTSMAAWSEISYEKPLLKPGPETDHVKHLEYLLHPDDFVLHTIDWRRKPEKILEIAQRLNIGLDSIAFLDDNHMELEEVRQSLPAVHIVTDNLYLARKELLTNPKYEYIQVSAESGNRSNMVKAQLKRDAAKLQHRDEKSFLKTLNIKLKISEETGEELIPRVLELIDRTNQFNTNVNFRSSCLRNKERARILTIGAEDRFINYGIVGVCIVHKNRIETFALSCRVIGLKIAHQALAEIIRNYIQNRPIFAIHIKTERNAPTHGLFEELGFKSTKPNNYQLDKEPCLPSTHAMCCCSNKPIVQLK